jgi:hypothetical protein
LKVLQEVDKHPKDMKFYEQHFFEPLDDLEWLASVR